MFIISERNKNTRATVDASRENLLRRHKSNFVFDCNKSEKEVLFESVDHVKCAIHPWDYLSMEVEDEYDDYFAFFSFSEIILNDCLLLKQI
jgi:hypothetical protein